MTKLKTPALALLALTFAGCSTSEDPCTGGDCAEQANDRVADPSEDTDTEVLDTDTEPIETVPDLVGNAYRLDPAQGNFAIPQGVGALLQPQLSGTDMLVGVTLATATEINLIGAMVHPQTGQQDVCTPTTSFPDPGDFTTDPLFSIQDASAVFQVEGVDVTVESGLFSGRFNGDDTKIVDVVMGGVMDTRPLVPLVGGLDPGTVCDLMITFGVSCVACPDGSGNFCTQLLIDQLEAELAPGITIVEVTAADVAANPACVNGGGGFTCSTTGLLLASSPFLWLLSAGFIRRRRASA